MSDNIVKELRESKIALHSTAHKAADEIDKLREELEAYDKTIKEHCDETTSLRADLAAVTAERDRMLKALAAEKALTNACERVNRRNDELLDKVRSLREALKPFSDAASTDDYIDDIEIAETDTARKITFGDLRRARAAIEGVTEKAGAGNE